MKRLAILAVPLLFVMGCGDKATPPKGSGPTSDPAKYSAGGQGGGAGAVVKDGKLVLSGYNTNVTFVGSKPDGNKHNGGFRNVTGTIQVSEAGIVSRIDAEFDVESLYTDNDMLTGHLKTPDFFDAKKHPKATFASTKVEANTAKPGEITVTGDLTMHGVKKSITFPATVGGETGKFGLSSTFKINRQDFEMKFGPDKVNDDVSITVTIGKSAQ
jgi:polyisoprenoid-binding protein YceI